MPKKTTVKKVAKKTTKKVVKKTTKSVSAGSKVAKKTTKKAIKKSTKSKTKLLVCAADKECFWTTDGQVLKNLDELRLAFGTMDDEVYLHHVTKEKNDFADWVDQILNDDVCASALRKSKKPTSAKTVVIRHLRSYRI